jgi:hypothetical protein
MPMKIAVSAATLFLVLGTTAAYAQRGQQGKEQAKPQQTQQQQKARPSQQQQRRQAKPVQQKQRANRPAQGPRQSYGGAYHGAVQPSGPTHDGMHDSGVPQEQAQVRAGFARDRAGSWKTDHRTWRQRGGYNGYRIPDDRYKVYFGRDHFFHINLLPLLFVGGRPRFQYDGYWITILDPWPEDWPPTWYETDDVYIEYAGDGYYLYNRNYPAIAVAVTISF